MWYRDAVECAVDDLGQSRAWPSPLVTSGGVRDFFIRSSIDEVPKRKISKHARGEKRRRMDGV